MNDLITLDDIATMHHCSIRHARDVIVRLPGFPTEAPTSTPRNRLWLRSEVREADSATRRLSIEDQVMTKSIPTRHCDECTHHRPVVGNELACAYDHKPRWFSPKGPLDQNYGWKRKCEDFRQIQTKGKS